MSGRNSMAAAVQQYLNDRRQLGYELTGPATELMRFAMPGNLTGLPAIAFPVGYDAAGLPTSMQAMARPWEEALLLRVAFAAEQATPRRRPPMFHEVL